MAYCGGMTIHNSLTAHIVNIHKAGIWQPGLARFSNDCVLGYYARLRCDQLVLYHRSEIWRSALGHFGRKFWLLGNGVGWNV